ncbi:hypothetical protein HMPREF0580_1826 [Mobiluncus mulieris ATCC 35239]|uniref:Uncharacterized protein n=1 Tax=Mobiluncus mulieris ATCC 35239 TaxID=871571 RepID=E0QSG1_9ACTO|nr:hypothetical protein HMPREF0580_1826 [Mobiluncus mulieris ATCC 35239]
MLDPTIHLFFLVATTVTIFSYLGAWFHSGRIFWDNKHYE